MTEIISGIYQLKVPIPNNPLGYTNTYLLLEDNECLLIDTGWNSDETLQSLKKQLAEIGVSLKDISQIVITHSHPDHYGLASRLKKFSSAKIAAHYLEKNVIISRYSNANGASHQLEQWLHINGIPTAELPTFQPGSAGIRRLFTPVLPDVTFQGSEIISSGSFNLQVFWTPGHSPGHICLYEPTQKILFSGDHILPVTTPNISLQPQSGANPLGDFLNSLNLVKPLDVNLVLPAHEHLFTNLGTRVEELFQHHKQRNLEILETMRTEPKTAYQISTGITWMPGAGGVSWQNLAPWDRRMAVLETLAHLEAMRVDKMIEKFSANSIIYYQRI